MLHGVGLCASSAPGKNYALDLLVRLVCASLGVERGFSVHVCLVYQYDSAPLFVHVLLASDCGCNAQSKASDDNVSETYYLVYMFISELRVLLPLRS